MFFDGTSAQLLLGPLLVPAAAALGIDLVHFGIVIAINITIGGLTPPFGPVMFVTTSITKVGVGDYTREMLPYFAQMLFCLILLTFIPDIAMLIPNLLG